MSGRLRIKEALDTVPGVFGRESEPKTKTAGLGWPVLRVVTRDGVMCAPLVRAYDVFVVLPSQDPTQTAEVADDLIEPLVQALEPLGEVGEGDVLAEVVQIQFNATSTVPGIRVRVIPDPEEG